MVLPYSTLVFALLASAFLAGVVLAFRGLRGRRVGTEPRCRRCGYDLTGGPERCPECGTTAAGKNAVIGVRRRRWPSASVGLALLLFSSFGLGSALYGQVSQVNWYVHLPQVLLVRLAERQDSEALEELVGRCNSGSARIGGLLRLVPLALEEQEAEWNLGQRAPWTALLIAIDSANLLSVAQREQFRKGLVSIQVDILGVRQGNDFKYCYTLINRGRPALIGSYTVEDAHLRFGDRVEVFADPPVRPLAQFGVAAYSCVHMPTHDMEPGTHWLSFEATIVFHNPSFTRRIKYEGEFPLLSPVGQPEAGQ